MKTTYIQFDEPKNENQISSDGILKRIFKKVINEVLTFSIPKANPDYDDKIGNVCKWFVEIENETGIPIREIGINEKGNTILKMPHRNNYGYWTDNNLLLDDFKNQFQAVEIDKLEFETKWNNFENSF